MGEEKDGTWMWCDLGAGFDVDAYKVQTFLWFMGIAEGRVGGQAISWTVYLCSETAEIHLVLIS